MASPGALPPLLVKIHGGPTSNLRWHRACPLHVQDFVAPPGALPPLLVKIHGGPTSQLLPLASCLLLACAGFRGPTWCAAAAADEGPRQPHHPTAAYNLLFACALQDFVAPPGALPPLLVKIHGGPTSQASTAFSLGLQYWTSRG